MAAAAAVIIIIIILITAALIIAVLIIKILITTGLKLRFIRTIFIIYKILILASGITGNKQKRVLYIFYNLEDYLKKRIK